MKRSTILCWLFLLIIIIPSAGNSKEAVLGTNLTGPKVEVTVSPDNVIYEALGSLTYQSNEPFTITLSTDNSVDDPDAIIPAGITVLTSQVTCEINPAYVTVNSEYNLFSGTDQKLERSLTLQPTEVSETWMIRGSLTVTVDYTGTDGDDNTVEDTVYEFVPFNIDLTFLRKTSFFAGADGDVLAVEAFQYHVDENNIIVREPYVGAITIPESSNLSFSPPVTSTMTTDYYGVGDSGVALFQIINPAGNAIENYGTANETVSLSADGIALPMVDITTFFAQVLTVVGTVETIDPLGQVSQVTPGMYLAPGSRLRGERFVRPDQSVIYPWVKIKFSNGVVEDIDLVDGDNGQLSVLLGSSGVEAVGKRYSRFDIALKELSFQIQNEPRELASRIVSQAIGKIAGALSGPYSMLVGTGTKYAVDTYYNYSRQKNLRIQPESVQSDSILISENNTDLQPGERYTWRLYDDGSYAFENRGPSLMVSTSDDREYFVPSRTSRKFSRLENGQPELPKVLPAPNVYSNPQTILSPLNGSTVSRTPEIIINHNLGVQKDTLACWINGINIGQMMQTQPTSYFPVTIESRFKVPPEMRLPEGQNTIEFRGADEAGNFFRTSATFTATGPPEIPLGVEVVAGQTSLVLRWSKNREHDLAGYRIYRSASAEGIYEQLSQTTEPVYSASASATTYWYAVSAIDIDGMESSLSTPVPASALSPSIPLLQAAGSFVLENVTKKNNMIKIEVKQSPPNTACWMIERSENGGLFTRLGLSGQGIFFSRFFEDTEVSVNNQYEYRFTALNGDLEEGGQGSIGPVAPLDNLPSPPAAITVERTGDTAIIRWNPSEDENSGYLLSVGIDTDPLQTMQNIIDSTETQFKLEGNKVYYFAVRSVDEFGQSGELSNLVEISTWGSGLPGGGDTSSSLILMLIPILSAATK